MLIVKVANNSIKETAFISIKLTLLQYKGPFCWLKAQTDDLYLLKTSSTTF